MSNGSPRETGELAWSALTRTCGERRTGRERERQREEEEQEKRRLCGTDMHISQTF